VGALLRESESIAASDEVRDSLQFSRGIVRAKGARATHASVLASSVRNARQDIVWNGTREAPAVGAPLGDGAMVGAAAKRAALRIDFSVHHVLRTLKTTTSSWGTQDGMRIARTDRDQEIHFRPLLPREPIAVHRANARWQRQVFGLSVRVR
jgi:hypothetical protein